MNRPIKDIIRIRILSMHDLDEHMLELGVVGLIFELECIGFFEERQEIYTLALTEHLRSIAFFNRLSMFIVLCNRDLIHHLPRKLASVEI